MCSALRGSSVSPGQGFALASGTVPAWVRPLRPAPFAPGCLVLPAPSFLWHCLAAPLDLLRALPCSQLSLLQGLILSGLLYWGRPSGCPRWWPAGPPLFLPYPWLGCPPHLGCLPGALPQSPAGDLPPLLPCLLLLAPSLLARRCGPPACV